MSTLHTKYSHWKKVFFVILYILIVSLFDSYAYGVIYGEKIKKENYNNRLASWVFEEKGKGLGADSITVPNYRFIQKSIEISGILLILLFFGKFPAIGLALSHYFLTYDMLYYIFLQQTAGLVFFEQTYSTYWLVNWYQSGYFLLKPFSSMNFYLSGTLGLLLAVTFCFIPAKKPKQSSIALPFASLKGIGKAEFFMTADREKI